MLDAYLGKYLLGGSSLASARRRRLLLAVLTLYCLAFSLYLKVNFRCSRKERVGVTSTTSASPAR